MSPLTWVIGIVVVLVLLVVFLYNALIRLKNQVENSWAQIDVQLKRRHDLIPNLIETVKGYAKHEKSLFTDVTKARTEVMKQTDVHKKAAASNMLTDALKSVFAVAEAYPDLKANQNFLQLQEELSGTENKISYARQHYNDMVMLFNTKIQTFPNNMIANILKFTDMEMFDVPEAEKKNVKVQF